MDFSSINFLALGAAAIASFGLGALWYSPVLFGKIWQQEIGMTEEDLKGANMPMIFGTTFVLTFIMGLGLAMIIAGHEGAEMNWMSGAHHGLYAGLAFVGTSMAINYLYQRRSFKLWAIDAGYQILFLTIMGAILGAWQ